MTIIEEIKDLKQRVTALEEARPHDETIALSKTFSQDLSNTDTVVNSLSKSVQELYNKLDTMEVQLEVMKKYIKELREWLKTNF
jgi:peptidoglycan hydrolase CwlO-like protein